MTLLSIKGVQFDLTAPAVWILDTPFPRSGLILEKARAFALLNEEPETLMISYILPVPNGKTAKERLLETIAFLEQEGVNDRAFEVLNALALGLLWSEESDTAVRALGQQIAQELYDNAMQNVEYETYLTNPENLSNW